WVLTPLYMALWNWKSTLPIPELIAVAVIPFNLIKGVLVSAVFALVAIRLKSWLNQKQLEQ
ncbi:MAG: ECF transporter S component, partial [Limosilactobacillus vaginalis]